MVELSPDSKAPYGLLKAEMSEIYEAKFLDYKNEILDAVRKQVEDTSKKIKASDTSINVIHADMDTARISFGTKLASIKGSLSVEIAVIAYTIDRALRSSSTAMVDETSELPLWPLEDGGVGPHGHREAPLLRGMAGAHACLLWSKVCIPATIPHQLMIPRLLHMLMIVLILPRVSNWPNSMVLIRNCGNGGARNTFADGKCRDNIGCRIRLFSSWVQLQLGLKPS
jgi:hypothetical protein